MTGKIGGVMHEVSSLRMGKATPSATHINIEAYDLHTQEVLLILDSASSSNPWLSHEKKKKKNIGRAAFTRLSVYI